MFLATTALKDFWNEDSEILFLGSWCIVNKLNRAKDWETVKSRVLPSPWQDREKLHQVFVELEQFYERLLNQLTEYLNAVHQVSYSKKYWRILVGEWLQNYLHMVCDRYVHLVEAFQRYPELETILLSSNSFKTPWDMKEFKELHVEDIYNLQIFSELLLGAGYCFPVKQATNAQKKPDINRHQCSSFNKQNGQVFRSERRDLFPHVLLGEMCCDAYMLQNLVKSVSSFGSYWPYQSRSQNFPKSSPIVFDEARLNLSRISASTEFEKVFVKTLPQNFPGLYLEGFEKARQETFKQFPVFPSVLVTLNDWHIYERFKFLAAEASEVGSRIIVGQHGGVYGTAKFTPGELHERKISDSYYVWGWAKDKMGYRNLPSLKTSSLLNLEFSKAKHWRNNNTILLLSTDLPRYLFRFVSGPITSQIIEGWEDLECFLSELPVSLRSQILWRSKLPDYGSPQRNIIARQFPEVKLSNFSSWSHWATTYYKSFSVSRVVVINNCSTSVLESLVLNIPTILVWKREHWEIRAEAEPYFDLLRKVGILWHSPEAAASHLACIYHEPWVWWESQEVQEARKSFVERYALARADWLESWVTALKEELVLSTNTEQSQVSVQKDNLIHETNFSYADESYLATLDLKYHHHSLNSELAVRNCYSVIKDFPNAHEAYKTLGKVLQDLGQHEAALRAYSKASKIKQR